MMENEKESGHELILDNRKLIIVFAILIAVCGGFFVVGFLEGKRQGYQEGFQAAAETAPKMLPSGLQAPTAGSETAEPDEEQIASDTAETSLNWYRSVNRRDGEPEPLTEPPPPAVQPAPKQTAKAVKQEPAKTAAGSAQASYSVQVGAFRARREAETAAKQLQARGFDCRIELPEAADGFYLVKVGLFTTRADALVMQRRLQESGFSTFIKTN